MHERIAKARPEVVYHLAAFTHVGQSFSAPERVLRVNIDGTANVLDASRAADVDRVIVIGSAEEYGLVAPEDLPLREDAPLRPVSPYAASKIAASYLALQAWLGGGLETIRVAHVQSHGPGSVTGLPHRRAGTPHRRGRTRRHRRNLHRLGRTRARPERCARHRAARTGSSPSTVNRARSTTSVPDGACPSRTWPRELLSHARRALRLVQDPDLVRPVDIPRLVGDPTKIHTATGWQPEYALHQTLGDVLTASRESRN